jgi:hypothetical protein
MKAFIVERYKSNSALRLGDMPEPNVRDHDVLVAIHAASLNQLDAKIRRSITSTTNLSVIFKSLPTQQRLHRVRTVATCSNQSAGRRFESESARGDKVRRTPAPYELGDRSPWQC